MANFKVMQVINLFLFAAVFGGGWVLLELYKSSKSMVWPIRGKITSPYGPRRHPITQVNQFHNGVDIRADEGAALRSPYGGVVERIYQTPAGGLSMVIKHNNGYRTGYAHLSGVATVEGDKVDKGDIIAYAGSTGRVTGPHLHFTLKDPSGNYVNPEEMISDYLS